MHFSSESSGDETGERRIWKWIKNFKEEKPSSIKQKIGNIREEDESSYTEFNASGLRTSSVNLDVNKLNCSNNSKSFDYVLSTSENRSSFEISQLKHPQNVPKNATSINVENAKFSKEKQKTEIIEIKEKPDISNIPKYDLTTFTKVRKQTDPGPWMHSWSKSVHE